MQSWAALGCAVWLWACVSGEPPPGPAAEVSEPRAGAPNVLLVLADDLGYQDLGVYGATSIETPHLDALAADGVRFAAAYSGSSVCTPARAALLTGRMGPRVSLTGRVRGVYFPHAPSGLLSEELTLAERLGEAGYATGLVGKWHLGDRPEFMPQTQGFDMFFGLPYSVDMDPLPLLDGDEVIEQLNTAAPQQTVMAPDTPQAGLTARLTARADAFIRRAHDAGKPFFLYYASPAPHIPLAPSVRFAGRSPSCESLAATQACGAYADVVAELDASVGELLETLSELGIEDETIVIFVSDNGAALFYTRDAGDNGPLRSGKGTTFEGGFVVPMIARFPGRYRAGALETTPVTLADWFPTLLEEAGLEPTADVPLDGRSLHALLRGEGPRAGGKPFHFVYYRPDNTTPGAYREGRWKYKAAVAREAQLLLREPDAEQLFNLETDPGETVNLADVEPERLAALREAMLAAHGNSVPGQAEH